MKASRSAFFAISLVCAWPVAAQEDISRDYHLNFEGDEGAEGLAPGSPIQSLGEWNGSSANAIVTGQDAYAGAQSLLIPGGASATLSIRPSSDNDAAVFFIDARVRATGPYSTHLETASTRRIPLLNWDLQDGLLALSVNDSEGSHETGVRRRVGADWERMTLRVDPHEEIWDLYLGGVLTVANMKLDIDGESLTGFTISAAPQSSCLVDGVALVADNPLFADADADGISDRYEALNGGQVHGNDRDEDARGNDQTNLENYLAALHALDSDGDGDDIVDGLEALVGSDASRNDAAGVPGLLRRDSWSGLKGDRVAALTRHTRMREGADITDYITRLEQPPGSGDNYATRIRGYLVAPESGDYRFWVSGDNHCELWLSSDDSRFHRALIAKVGRFTGFREWDRYHDQASELISLEAGQSYFIEVFHKEGVGEDHFSVSWQRPSGYREVIEGRYLRAYQPDAADRDDDNLPDSWEIAHGLDPADGHDAQADADGDGASNEQEYRYGMNPRVPDAAGAAGLVRYEVWHDLRGEYPFDLTQHPDFPDHPTQIRYLEQFEAPSEYAENFGARLRAYVRAPETGDYRFHVCGDDRGELWLSTGRKKFGKRLIATLPGPTDWAEWDKYEEQGSSPIRLVKGRVYYLEALHKESAIYDHFSVAWQVPGGQLEVIGGEFLTAYQLDPEDADDDDLKDVDERRHGLVKLSDETHSSRWSAYGDLDGDGVNNVIEIERGTNPAVAEEAHIRTRVRWERWLNLEGYFVSDLTADERFPRHPDEVEYLNRLTTRSSTGDQYGSRIRGYIIAPETDAYRFVISGDNNCEFWLSTGESPFDRELVAQIKGWTRLRRWGDYPSQQSEPRDLEKGRRYYFEILHKEQEGSDYVTIAWETDKLPHQIIEGNHLAPFAPVAGDHDDDGLPDQWERRHGLRPDMPAGDEGSFGDPDGDHLPNYQEFQLGSNPQIPDARGRPGLLLWEKWDGIRGRSVADFVTHPAALREPSEVAYLTEFMAPQGLGDDYASRIRGFIVPPVTGDYSFLLASDDGGELWFSSDGDKFKRRLIAQVESWVSYNQWTQNAAQRSHPIPLTAGQEYYVEVRHKEGIWQDHVSVAWMPPGHTSPEIIPGAYLISYRPHDNDADDDDLPDDWEWRNGLSISDNGSGDAAHGLYGDLDSDGLTNLQEYQRGTRADRIDSDEDGISDFDELHVFGTDPTQSDVGSFGEASSIPGADFSTHQGKWQRLDGRAYSRSSPASADYTWKCSRSGVYLLSVFLTPKENGQVQDNYELLIYLDDQLIRHAEKVIPFGETGEFRALNPFVQTGDHTIRVFLRNTITNRQIFVDRLELSPATGPDEDGNSQPDWIDRLLRISNSISPDRLKSFVSPACLEGTARYPSLVRCSSGTAMLLPNQGWYCNVPLQPGSETATSLTFENGAVVKDLRLQWVPTDVFAANAITVRQGDALLLGSHPAQPRPGVARISIADHAYVLHPDEPGVVHRFHQPGRYHIVSEMENNGPRGDMWVTVIAPPDAGSPVAVKGFLRGLDRGAFDPRANEYDNRLRVFDNGSGAVLFALDKAAIRYIAHRTPAGAVLGATTIRGLDVAHGFDTSISYAENLGDGYHYLDMPIIVSDLYPDIKIRVEIFVGGVLFDDGSTTKTLAYADFDSLGRTVVRFLKAPEVQTAICHRLKVLQNDEFIAYYE